jgi:hypothetical protein
MSVCGKRNPIAWVRCKYDKLASLVNNSPEATVEYDIAIGDGNTNVDYIAEYDAVQAAYPGKTIKVENFFLTQRSIDVALGISGISFDDKEVYFLIAKPVAGGHALRIKFGVY